MNKNISDIMQTAVITANVNDSVEKVEKLISKNNKSFVPIIDDDKRCFGIISNSDILKFHQEKRNTKREFAWEICTHSVINIEQDLSILDAANLLIKNNIHHLVVSQGDEVRGVVSSIDLLNCYVQECL